MSLWSQRHLMDPATPLEGEMILFHDHAMVLLVGIFSLVVFGGVKLLKGKLSSRVLLEAQLMETIWTVLPALLLVWLALPSLRLLYVMDEQGSHSMVLKSTGHQWYWTYELPATSPDSFDSYMVAEEELPSGNFRLLEVDSRAAVPYGVVSTAITTSADVLHAWALPAAGIKMDAVPGRLNSMDLTLLRPGVFYGQCSEICGANHSFMPIVVEAVKTKEFLA